MIFALRDSKKMIEDSEEREWWKDDVSVCGTASTVRDQSGERGIYSLRPTQEAKQPKRFQVTLPPHFLT
jgi:hypothetical protein